MARTVSPCRGRITLDERPLPLAEETDDARRRAVLGPLPETPLASGVAQTIALFKSALAEERLARPSQGS